MEENLSSLDSMAKGGATQNSQELEDLVRTYFVFKQFDLN
jgi:hypothetical protein